MIKEIIIKKLYDFWNITNDNIPEIIIVAV